MQNLMQKYPKLVPLITVIVALVIGGGSVALVVDDDGDGPHAAKTVTVVKVPAPITKIITPVDTADKDTKPDSVVTTSAPALTDVQKNTEQNLRAENPTAENVEKQDQAAANDQLPAVSPDAAPSQRGCNSAFVVNYSSRRGVAPRVITLHETVSNDIRGTADVNAIVSWFNNPQSQASSNYTIDREGNCRYMVRESDKAWAQASANPWVVSFEIINPAKKTATVKNLIDGAGRKKLLGIINDVSKRWNIPIRSAKTNGCSVKNAGINDHYTWGACGGGHVDTTPFRASLKPIIIDARKLCVKRYTGAHHAVPARCKA